MPHIETKAAALNEKALCYGKSFEEKMAAGKLFCASPFLVRCALNAVSFERHLSSCIHAKAK